MELYKAVEIKDGNSTEPVQYVGVYALNWQKEWGEPEIAFVEAELSTPPPTKGITEEGIDAMFDDYKGENIEAFRKLNYDGTLAIRCGFEAGIKAISALNIR